MERERNDILETRAHTDASLVAERAGVDATIEVAALTARRLLDDLIERDRALADERLMKYRASADRVLASERSASPTPGEEMAQERVVADESKISERAVTDALLERERRRADARVEDGRRDHEIDRAEHASQRQDTDDRLSEERDGADRTLATLGVTKHALADARSEHDRRAEVLAMVTHDLRSPLSVIVANAVVIAEDATEPSTREAAHDVTRAAARMGRLLTDLLDTARIESGTFRIVKRPHDVGALLTEVLQSYRPLFEERGLAFSVVVPNEPLIAAFDHDRIVQLLSNLLGNAMKFTPLRGTVDLHAEPGDGCLELVLRDTGSGIDPVALPHVFERFWQSDTDTRRGLGLGLYICRTIAEAHGGSISVESELGRGSTFHLRLPR